MATTGYLRFLSAVRDIRSAQAIEALLDWDQETQMPRKAAEDRANQLALIAGIAHEKLTSDAFENALVVAEHEAETTDTAAVTNVREMRRLFERARRLPRSLVEELAKASSLAKDAWSSARRENDFPRFAPHLDRILALKRDTADKLGWKRERYDALLEEYEPGMTAGCVQAVFDALRSELVSLVRALVAAPRQPDTDVLRFRCPRDAQAAFNRRIVTAMGFDLEAGRIDTSVHPFCTGITPRDVRLTTRYDESYLPTSLFGIIHEAGHGLYEQGFDPVHTGTPMAHYASMGIHESQSRLWENSVGRGLPFWRHFFPVLREAFPALSQASLDTWHFAINSVRPSCIRVEADEVTYGLHIMLRFDIERRLLDGALRVSELPEAWNAAMADLLGITPATDAEGCLQDIHWSMGAIAYFPTYQLGNLYAAQIFSAARRAIGDLDSRLARGDLVTLRDWLRDNIHRHGQRFRPQELLERVCGERLSHRPFMTYLQEKYAPLYGLTSGSRGAP